MRRQLLIFFVAIVIAAGVGVLWSSSQQEIYEAEAQLLVVPQSVSIRQVEPIEPLYPVHRGIDDEIDVLRSDELGDAVADQLGYRPTVDITMVDASDVITITARGKSPERVASAANVYAETYIASRRQGVVNDLNALNASLERDLVARTGRRESLMTSLVPPNQIQQLDDEIFRLQQQLEDTNAQLNSPSLPVGATQIATAAVPTDPISPRPVRNVLVALAIGLAVGLVLMLVLQVSWRRPRSGTSAAAVAS